LFTKLSLYYHTLKYLRCYQILGKIHSALKLSLPEAGLNLNEVILYGKISKKTGFLNHDPWNNAEKILEGQFCFLNKSAQLGFPPKWDHKNGNLLWEFNLQYMNYLFLLSDEQKIFLISDWIRKNTKRNSVAWHPYIISLRTVNIIKAGIDSDEINRSLYEQARHLYRNLEFYHPANHYLENAKALIFCGTYFRGSRSAENWITSGRRIIKKQLQSQILGDGVHFERSVMYHLRVLENLLDLLNISDYQDELNPLLRNYCSLMIKFLKDATHPDGTIAMFNDSSPEIYPSTDRIIGYAEDLGIEIHSAKKKDGNIQDSEVWTFVPYTEAGYYIAKTGSIYFMFDAGPIGPDHIPAHSHGDIFSYEFSYKGRKFAVDPGVYDYTAGLLRHYARGTGSHNTLTIDERDQAEFWGAFRVGRRYPPEKVSVTNDDNLIKITGSFKGFSRLIGDNLIHSREVVIGKSLPFIEITDFLYGRNNHTISSSIHLHPDVLIHQENGKIILENKGVKIRLNITGGSFAILDGRYFPEFGVELNNKVIKISYSKIPSKLGYKFCFTET